MLRIVGTIVNLVIAYWIVTKIVTAATHLSWYQLNEAVSTTSQVFVLLTLLFTIDATITPKSENRVDPDTALSR